MNSNKYAFRFVVTIVAFLLGYSANSAYHQIDSDVVRENETAVSMNLKPSSASTNEIFTESSFDLQPPVVDGETYTAGDFNLTGEYYLLDEKVPSAFKDFEYLEIETHAYNDATDPEDSTWTPIPPKGSFKAKRSHKLKFLMISPAFVSFETVAIRGISYRFVGRVRQANETAEEGSSGDISGKLSKVEYGKVVATMNAEFVVGGC